MLILRAWPDDRDAAEALARISEPSMVRRILDTPAAAVFVRAKGEAGAGELRLLALDGDQKIARAASTLLPGFDSPQTRRTLSVAADRAATREASIVALVRIGDFESLKRFVETSPAAVKGEVASALGQAKSDDLRPSLLNASLNPAISLQSAQALLDDYPAEEIVPALIPALENYYSRSRAGELLKRLTGEQLPPTPNVWIAWLQKSKEE
jgi:hypothetical protein